MPRSCICTLCLLFVALVSTGSLSPAVAQADTTQYAPGTSNVTVETAELPRFAPSYVPVIAYWEKGDERMVKISQGKRLYEEGQLTSSDSSMTRYRVRVEEASDGHYLVRWLPIDYVSSDPTDVFAEDLDDDLAVQLEQEGYLIRTNEMGEFVELENEEVVSALMADVWDAIVEREEDPEMREKLGEFLAYLGGPDFLVQKMMVPLVLYYSLHGYEWPADAPRAYVDELPMPSGGVIAAPGLIKVTDIDEKAGTFRLTNRLEAEPEPLREAVIDVLAVGRSREEVVREMGSMTVELRDENQFFVDYDEGWVLSLDRLRIVEAAMARREEYVTIRAGAE